MPSYRTHPVQPPECREKKTDRLLSHVRWRRRRIGPRAGGGQPALLQDRPCQLLIDVGLDQLSKRKVELPELDPAAARTRFRQIADLDEITERLPIGPESKAHQIEEALRRRAMLAGECHQPGCYFRILNGVSVRIGG